LPTAGSRQGFSRRRPTLTIESVAKTICENLCYLWCKINRLRSSI
jgi:hypothetical protein